MSENCKTEIQNLEKSRQLLQDEKKELNKKLRNLEHLNRTSLSEKEP